MTQWATYVLAIKYILHLLKLKRIKNIHLTLTTVLHDSWIDNTIKVTLAAIMLYEGMQVFFSFFVSVAVTTRYLGTRNCTCTAKLLSALHGYFTHIYNNTTHAPSYTYTVITASKCSSWSQSKKKCTRDNFLARYTSWEGRSLAISNQCRWVYDRLEMIVNIRNPSSVTDSD